MLGFVTKNRREFIARKDFLKAIKQEALQGVVQDSPLIDEIRINYHSAVKHLRNLYLEGGRLSPDFLLLEEDYPLEIKTIYKRHFKHHFDFLKNSISRSS